MSRPRAMYQLDDPAESIKPLAINMGIYSYPGTGKTALWGTGGPTTLIMDSDGGGVESARALGSKATVLPVTDYDALSEAYEWVKHEGIKEGLKWCVWDSLTLFQDRALIDEILVDAHIENPRQSEDVASQREYLINMNRISKYVRMFVELPINFGISFHIMTGMDPEGNVIYMPMLQGKKGEFASYICGYLNVVAYLGLTQSGKRRIITDRSQAKDYFAKDRFHALRTNGKGFLDNPTVPKIGSLVEAARAGKPSGTPVRRRRRVTPAQP